MTTVAIVPVSSASGTTYQASSGSRLSEGRTAGEALDALTLQLPDDDGESLIVVQRFRGDAFFSAAQQARLKDLMQKWRMSRDSGRALPADEEAELQSLVDAELAASAARASHVAEELRR